MKGVVGSYCLVLDYVELDKETDCNDASHVGGDCSSDDNSHKNNDDDDDDDGDDMHYIEVHRLEQHPFFKRPSFQFCLQKNFETTNSNWMLHQNHTHKFS